MILRLHLLLLTLLLILSCSPNAWSQDEVVSEAQIDKFFDLAEQNYESGDLSKALINLDSAAALNPSHSRIYLIRANIYLYQENLRKALQEYDEAIKYDGNNAQSFYKRSRLRHDLRDHREYSLNDIDRAIELDPGNAFYFLEKALYLTSSTYPLPEYEMAINCITQAIALEPKNGEYYNVRAKYKSESSQPLSSLPDFSKAIELAPDSATYFHDRGLTYLIIDDYSSAIADLNSAIQLDPLNEKYLMMRGHARFNSGQYEVAILDFTLSIDTIYKKISETPGRINQNDPLNISLRRVYLFRGSALLQVESTYEACEDFKVASSLGNSLASKYVSRYCK